jgi:hypothetical protein
MAIKQFITLEGAEQVVANLKKISDAGEQALAKFRQSGQQFVATDQFTNSLNQTSQALARTSGATSEFRDALHVLRPILAETGLAASGFGEFAIAARAGIEGLALAIVGSLVVAAAKAADAFANMQRSMAFLFGAQGTNALDELKKSADAMGTSVVNLEPALIAIENALQRISGFKGVGLGGAVTFGSPEQQKAAIDAIATLEKELVNLGQTGAAAAGEVVKFFETVSKIDPATKKPMGLTLQAFLDLQRSAPEVAKFIGDALQANLGGDIWARLQKGPIDFLALLKAIAAQKATVDLQPIPPTVAKSFEDVKTAANDLLETLGRIGLATGVTQFLSDLTKGLQDSKAQIQAFLQFFSPENFSIVQTLAKIDWSAAFAGLIAAGVAAVAAAQQAITDGFNQLIQTIAGLSWAGVFNGLLSAAQTVFQAIQTAWQALVNFINSTQFQAPQPGVGGAPSVTEFASGGFVSGPGSTTSDSIIARLSNFEYVMRAAAVKFYGVDFMHAINALRLPKDFFRGFNLGGLVLPPFPSPPKFAQGGLAMAGQSRSLTLVLDGRSFAMAGSKNVVDDLERAADLHNLSRMGRAPGWVR